MTKTDKWKKPLLIAIGIIIPLSIAIGFFSYNYSPAKLSPHIIGKTIEKTVEHTVEKTIEKPKTPEPTVEPTVEPTTAQTKPVVAPDPKPATKAVAKTPNNQQKAHKAPPKKQKAHKTNTQAFRVKGEASGHIPSRKAESQQVLDNSGGMVKYANLDGKPYYATHDNTEDGRRAKSLKKGQSVNIGGNYRVDGFVKFKDKNASHEFTSVPKDADAYIQVCDGDDIRIIKLKKQ